MLVLSEVRSRLSANATLREPSADYTVHKCVYKQVLSFESHTVPKASSGMGWDEEQTVASRGFSGECFSGTR